MPCELLAPAGEPRALRAALAAGADAVYFGLERWSARAFAGNFGGEAVLQAVDLAHLYDARAYLALNTLLKDDEIEPALEALEAPYRAGLDALIVADLGFAALVRDEYPDLLLHASTQLNTHSSAQLAALQRLGFSRAILARELSLAEIAALDSAGLELESFVHGALCYGYSGDCLLSSMVGGRSGNRGRCSQSCRLRYALVRAEGAALEPSRAMPTSRVMSTSDLAAIGVLPQLMAAGVSSFKIEGRMKDAGYVGVTTAVYREALDSAIHDPEGYEVRPEWHERLEQSFSRSFTIAHLEGRHDEVRSGGRGGHRGVLVGRVSAVEEATGAVRVKLSKPVAEGDVVYLYTSSGQTEPQRLEIGGGDHVALRVRERVAIKDRLFRLAAADVGRLGHDLQSGRTVLRPTQLTMRLSGAVGSPAQLTVTDEGSGSVTVMTVGPLAAARTSALTEGRARDALGALGGTPYRLANLAYTIDGEVFLPVGDLKDLRRRAVAALDERRLAARRRHIRSAGSRTTQDELAASGHRRAKALGASNRQRWAAEAPSISDRQRPASGAPHTTRDRQPAAPPLVLRLRVAEKPLPLPSGAGCCLDLETGDAPDAVAQALDALRAQHLYVRARLPEVLFDADADWLAAILALPWSAVVTRGLAATAQLRTPFVIECPLQGLNALTADVVTRLTGRVPAAITVSPEASLDELCALRTGLSAAANAGVWADVAASPDAAAPPAIEILAFGRQQVLRTRDRLGRAEGLYEAPGPHEHIALLLRDAKEYEFPVEVDAGGTRVFNARVTNLASSLAELRAAGVATFIVEQAAMDAAETKAFAAGGLEALASLASRERSTTGHLYRGVA